MTAFRKRGYGAGRGASTRGGDVDSDTNDVLRQLLYEAGRDGRGVFEGGGAVDLQKPHLEVGVQDEVIPAQQHACTAYWDSKLRETELL